MRCPSCNQDKNGRCFPYSGLGDHCANDDAHESPVCLACIRPSITRNSRTRIYCAPCPIPGCPGTLTSPRKADFGLSPIDHFESTWRRRTVRRRLDSHVAEPVWRQRSRSPDRQPSPSPSDGKVKREIDQMPARRSITLIEDSKPTCSEGRLIKIEKLNLSKYDDWFENSTAHAIHPRRTEATDSGVVKLED